MPVTPEVLRLAQEYRAQLLARERAAASRLVYQYGVAWRGLQADIIAAQKRVVALRTAGVEITSGQVLRIENMERIQAQVAVEMARYSQFANAAIVQANREALAAGLTNAAALLRAGLPAGSGIAVLQPSLPRRAVEAMIALMADGTPLEVIIRRIAGAASKDFMDTLVRGLVSGWNPRKLARELRNEFGGSLTEILRVARTEQLRAYRAATQQVYQENDRVLEGWMWMAAKEGACMACLMMDGTMHPLDEPLVDHPNGKCVAAPITKSYRELGGAPVAGYERQTGEEWFRAQDDATQQGIMGQAKWDAWQEGKFALADIPHQAENDVWGNHWAIRSLDDLLGSEE